MKRYNINFNRDINPSELGLKFSQIDNQVYTGYRFEEDISFEGDNDNTKPDYEINSLFEDFDGISDLE